MLPSKELASVHELLQHVFARRFIAPFALRKQRSGPRHRQQSSRFLPAYACDYPSPTSARRSPEPHRAGRAREFVHVLSAYKLKDRTHVIRYVRLNALIRHLGHIVLNQPDVLRNKLVPEPKHLVAQQIHGLAYCSSRLGAARARQFQVTPAYPHSSLRCSQGFP